MKIFSRHFNMLSHKHYNIAAIVSFALLALYIFSVPLFSSATFFPPVDNPPFFSKGYQLMLFHSFYGLWDFSGLGMGRGGWPFVPSMVGAIIFPPLFFHLHRYIWDTLLLMLATAFFLKGRGFSGISQWLPAIGMAFSGYTFTLISAGHSGYFDMVPFAVLVFGCIDRGFRRRRMIWFGWAGVCAAFGLGTQPDVLALFCLMAFFYSVLLFFENLPEKPSKPEIMRYICFVVTSAFVSSLVLLTVAASALAYTSESLEMRQTVRGDSPEQRWEYATNWSMPPEELLELAAPFIYGIETGDRKGPYWGRLGRSVNWNETRQGLMNLRQHTLYMGLIPLILGFYAFVWSLRRIKSTSEKAEGANAAGDERFARREVWFWSGAFVLTVILAMGRYTPVYRLFYMLPYFSKIRAPVKFIHLSELALAVLFAYGLAALIEHVSARTVIAGKKSAKGIHTILHKRRFIGFSIGCAVLGLLFGLLALSLPGLGALLSYWADLGFSGYSEVLASQMKTGFLRAMAISFVATLVFVLPLITSKYAVHFIGAVLWVVVCVDMATVGKPYVRTGDVRPWYNENPVAERILADPDPVRTAFYLGPPSWRNWVFGSLAHYGVDVTQPMQLDYAPPEIDQRFFGALQNSPLRLWEITNTRYIIGAREQFAQLLAHPMFKEIMSFDLQNGRYVPVSRNGPYVLLRFDGALPRAMLYYHWEQAEPEDVLRKMATPQWDPRESVFVSRHIADHAIGAPVGVGKAEITRYGRTRVDVSVEADARAVLLLRDKYDPDWRVTVNGGSADVLRCNYIMRGVMVPEGKSTVVFTYRPNLPWFLLSLAGFLAMCFWCVFCFFKKRQ